MANGAGDGQVREWGAAETFYMRSSLQQQLSGDNAMKIWEKNIYRLNF